MQPETLFVIVNAIAIFGWVLLIVFPSSQLTKNLVINRTLPLGLALAYLIFLIIALPSSEGGITSLDQILLAFENTNVNAL